MLLNVCHRWCMARPKGHPLNRDAWEDWLERHLGVSVTAIADVADIPRATISGLVGGYRRASAPVAHKLAQAMGCKVGTLFPTLGASAGRFNVSDEEVAA